MIDSIRSCDSPPVWPVLLTRNTHSQTMSTPMHTYVNRTDNKVYRVQTPQAPLIRTRNYVRYGLDEYPNGTNVILAVISYTGCVWFFIFLC